MLSGMKKELSISFIIASFLLFPVASCTKGFVAPAGLHTTFLSHPSNAQKRIEVFWMRPETQGPHPAIIFIHGHQTGDRAGGEAFVSWGVLEEWSGRGYVAAAVSQPGYGNSDGPPDFCGRFTQDAIEEVIRYFREQEFVQPGKIALEGISRGAVAAAMVATRDSQIAALVLISGEYDFSDYKLDALTLNNVQLELELGREAEDRREALQERSALFCSEQIKSPSLILNGGKDDRTNPDHAKAFAQRIQENGTFARAIIYSDFGHNIPVQERDKEINSFLEKWVMPSASTIK